MELGIPDIGEATEVGVGASAQVFRARQLKLDREVAVKVLSTTDPDFVRRFHREARTLGRLSRHDGIVTLYEFGETSSGQPYLILELCDGSLLDEIKQQGTFEAYEACRVIQTVAGTVASAHSDEVVHRDLKPANILVNHAGNYLITDFGISTVLGSTAGQTSSVGFTAGYAAPETFEGGSGSGKQADVYALGATLFHMLAGQPPFTKPGGDQNLLALIQRIALEPPPDLRPIGVPSEVCDVLERVLAKDPAQRPDAAALATELGGVVPTTEGPAIAPHPPPMAAATIAVPRPDEAPDGDSTPPSDNSTGGSDEAGGGDGRGTGISSGDDADRSDGADGGSPRVTSPTGSDDAAAAGVAGVAGFAADRASWPPPAATDAAALVQPGEHAVSPDPLTAAPPPGGVAKKTGDGTVVERPTEDVGQVGQRAVADAAAGSSIAAGGGGRGRAADLLNARHPVLTRVALPAALLAILAAGAVWLLLRSGNEPDTSAVGDSTILATDEADAPSDDPASPTTGTGDAAGGGADEGAEGSTDSSTSNDGEGTTATDSSESTTSSTTASGSTTSTTSTTTGTTNTTLTTNTTATTTTTGGGGITITSISGPSTVECWSDNYTYTANTSGGTATSWNWNTGSVGLQTPFNSGPSAVLSFDLDPGTYTITVTANGSASASKSITVTSGPGCAPTAPNPVITGPATVDCNTSVTYSVSAPNGVPLTSYAWSADGPTIQGSTSGQSITVFFNVSPGTYNINVTVNGIATTKRTITVHQPPCQ